MSIEALWSVEFTEMNSRKISGGVIVIESNRILGGDTWQWYTGTYKRDEANGKYSCVIQTGVHFFEGGSSIFGGAPRAQKLEGELIVNSDQNTIVAVLSPVGEKGLLRVTLSRVAELP
jgi:hypothetical protein